MLTVRESEPLGPEGGVGVVTTVGSAVDTVEAEIRGLVRRRGLDPVEGTGSRQVPLQR